MYFRSNKVINWIHFRWGCSLFSIFWYTLLILLGLFDHQLICSSLMLLLVLVHLMICIALVLAYQFLPIPDQQNWNIISNTYLELMPDMIVINRGRAQQIVKNNIRSIEEIDFPGKEWRITLENGRKVRIGTKMLTDIQSTYIKNRVDLIAQLVANKDHLLRVLQNHLSSANRSGSECPQ